MFSKLLGPATSMIRRIVNKMTNDTIQFIEFIGENGKPIQLISAGLLVYHNIPALYSGTRKVYLYCKEMFKILVFLMIQLVLFLE